jgi:hypothetical protein
MPAKIQSENCASDKSCSRAILALTCTFMFSGCATDSLFGAKTATTTTQAPSTSFSDQFNNFFRGQPAKPAVAGTATATADAPADIDCPQVQVREGAATYAQNASDGDQSALSLRWQATFGQNARECHVSAGMLTIKVGVEGRVILGPAGAPSNVVVPLRYALVQEGVQPKTIWTKFYPVPVSLTPDSGNVPWTHIQQDIVVPLPKSSELDAYVIYIGFDPNGLEASKPAKPKPKSKARTSSAATGSSSSR